MANQPTVYEQIIMTTYFSRQKLFYDKKILHMGDTKFLNQWG